jgi:hypothetical protein
MRHISNPIISSSGIEFKGEFTLKLAPLDGGSYVLWCGNKPSRIITKNIVIHEVLDCVKDWMAEQEKRS